MSSFLWLFFLMKSPIYIQAFRIQYFTIYYRLFFDDFSFGLRISETSWSSRSPWMMSWGSRISDGYVFANKYSTSSLDRHRGTLREGSSWDARRGGKEWKTPRLLRTRSLRAARNDDPRWVRDHPVRREEICPSPRVLRTATRGQLLFLGAQCPSYEKAIRVRWGARVLSWRFGGSGRGVREVVIQVVLSWCWARGKRGLSGSH